MARCNWWSNLKSRGQRLNFFATIPWLCNPNASSVYRTFPPLLHRSKITGLMGGRGKSCCWERASKREQERERESTCYIRHSTWFFNAELVSQKVCLLGDKWEYFIFILFYDSFALEGEKGSSVATQKTTPKQDRLQKAAKEYNVKNTSQNVYSHSILIKYSIFFKKITNTEYDFNIC